MKETIPMLNLEVEEIESRQRGGGSCTSSSTSRFCTCKCIGSRSQEGVASN